MLSVMSMANGNIIVIDYWHYRQQLLNLLKMNKKLKHSVKRKLYKVFRHILAPLPRIITEFYQRFDYLQSFCLLKDFLSWIKDCSHFYFSCIQYLILNTVCLHSRQMTMLCDNCRRRVQNLPDLRWNVLRQ